MRERAQMCVIVTCYNIQQTKELNKSLEENLVY